MKILIIDSHKGGEISIPQNLHWQNANILAQHLGADLIWSYPTVNDNIKSGYDVIIFVHASPYAYTDYEWLQKSPDAKLYMITNEYNLGEPRTLWMAAKDGRKYTVLANHPPEPSKLVKKYIDDWKFMNLNTLIYNPILNIVPPMEWLFQPEKSGCVYYGSFRKDRSEYFTKYLTSDVVLSTHSKNVEKFRNVGANSLVIPRIAWAPKGVGISEFEQSLYIEDKKTHIHYNHLANRFYEALNYDCTPIFGVECMNTIEKSGYKISEDYIIDNANQIKDKIGLELDPEWHSIALREKKEVINNIKKIIYNE